MHVLRLRLYAPLIVLACLFGCADKREPVAREHLRESVASQSNGALTLASMTKTNGFEHERDGMKLHTVEWEASLQVNTDGWKAGWRDYQVLPHAPNALAAAVEGASVRRVLRGATVVLQGKSELQKADKGWRVLNSEVTGFKITSAPDNPSEGRSTDIQAFWGAFKQALATKDTHVVAKFVRFPLEMSGYPMANEAEFHAQPPWGDAHLAPLLQVASPTKRDERTYIVTAPQFGVEFQKDRDGYWKWVGYNYGTELMGEVETPEDVE